MTFDFDKLRGMVRAKKEREGLSYRAVCKKTGVAAGTVCNFIHGRKPDADTAARLAAWVGLSVGHFAGRDGAVACVGDTLTNVEKLLREDPALRPSDRKGLMTILRTAYGRAVER